MSALRKQTAQTAQTAGNFYSRFPFLRRVAWIICWTGFWGAGQAQTNFQIVKSFGFPALSTGASPQAQMILGSDGALYGVTASGGSNAQGVVFRINTNGTGYQVLHSFAGGTNDGSGPAAELLQASDGLLYGTTGSGGTNGSGVIYGMSADGTGFHLVHSFAFDDGTGPEGGLLEGREDGVLYGTTSYGGKTNVWGGTVFKVNKDGSGFDVLYNFGVASGAEPECGMVEGADGYLYGTTITEGGYYSNGSIFKLARDGSFFENLYGFLGNYGDGGWAQGRLVQGSDGYLYGTCKHGGNPSSGIFSYIGNGTIYKINTNGGGYQVLYAFPTSASTGDAPVGGLHFGPDGYLYGAASGGGSGGFGTLFKLPTTGGSVTVLHNFDGGDGSVPDAAIIPGPGDVFYGVAASGGSAGFGTAFQVADDGSSFSVLHNFVTPAGGDGTDPEGPVSIYGKVVYGTTSSGGAAGAGMAFAMNLDGSGYQFLHSFTNGNGDGYQPQAALLKGADGFLYGTTASGGTTGNGVVFKLGADGSSYTVLYEFTNGPGDGAAPLANLIQGADGALYGTTDQGGSNYSGTVFKLNTSGGGYTLLYNFAGSPDGAEPAAPLLQDRYGTLYGTTQYGGTNGDGTIFSLATNGAGYQVVYDFDGSTNDGAYPQAGLLQGQDGMLYGTDTGGGSNYSGTVFGIGTNGAGYKVLYNFTNGFDGSSPQAQLVQGGNGSLYGTCSSGGLNGDGILFRLDLNGGAFTVLHVFSSQDCRNPAGGLALAPDGSFFGAANFGGNMNCGAVFKLFSAPPETIGAVAFGPTGMSLSFTGGLPNQTYQLLASTNLVNWAPIATPASDANGSFQYLDADAGGYRFRFYKTSGP
ncbi:MAG: choice-of-anchor tandem repeat GloVer-containing protein [Verrucomicrobiota bacterium]|jgi:uncharacterized repeat protein (TIGR03803 family)